MGNETFLIPIRQNNDLSDIALNELRMDLDEHPLHQRAYAELAYLPGNSRKYSLNSVKTIDSPLRNKKILFLGSSVTFGFGALGESFVDYLWKKRICGLFLNRGQCAMSLDIISFGFKYGLPQEADIVLDVRCLPNPFYVPELKELTGLDQPVVDYVMASPDSQGLLRRYESMLEFSLPLYVKEGKSQLVVAVGCTGGQHRSITFARKLGEFCETLGYKPNVLHRDARRGR